MTRTPETLARHELVGLDVRVVAASNPDLLDIDGEVVMETTNTLHIERGDRAWQVPKAGTTFAFELDSGTVRIEGDRLVARPARRTEHTGDSTWR
jgi:ribonuclease P protein subunit POP4